MTTDDDTVWRDYAKGVKKTTLRGSLSVRKVAPLAVSEKREGDKKKAAEDLVEKRGARLAGSKADGFSVLLSARETPVVSFSKKRERALRRGAVVLDGKLDLHGLTQKQAHEKLQSFTAWHASRGAHLLLVVTGKGRDGNSVLRANLPRWCATGTLADFVRTVRPAALAHGSEGAFYLFLKRAR